MIPILIGVIDNIPELIDIVSFLPEEYIFQIPAASVSDKYTSERVKFQEDTEKNIIFLSVTVEKGFEQRYIKCCNYHTGRSAVA